MNALVKVPRKHWPTLRDLYLADWPKGAAAYCLLDTQINNPKLSDKFNFKVYCPFGDFNNGVIASTNEINYIHLFILPLNGTEKIEDALIQTKLINWKVNMMVPFASPDTINSLVKISKQIDIKIKYEDGKAIKHLLSNDTALFDLSIPAGTFISSLRREHIDTVNKTWSYYNERSREFFEALMENGMAYVLYSLDEKPMAWITVNEAGAFTHLFCLEPFRRRGYAEVITKYACNDLLKKGRHIIAYTIESNDRSQRLFGKLGFKIIGCDYWACINTM